jgi:putative tryptophan/tyrosine transport system substrate-binding protein
MPGGRRRRFLIAVAGAIAAPLASSQQAGRARRVGLVLAISPLAEMAGPDPVHPITRAIVHELRSLGYIEGKNLILERRSAEGYPQRYRSIIAELVAGRTAVLVLAGERSLIRAAKAATSSVPMVLSNYPTPVEDGFAASLARPGGNITGTTGGTG